MDRAPSGVREDKKGPLGVVLRVLRVTASASKSCPHQAHQASLPLRQCQSLPVALWHSGSLPLALPARTPPGVITESHESRRAGVSCPDSLARRRGDSLRSVRSLSMIPPSESSVTGFCH